MAKLAFKKISFFLHTWNLLYLTEFWISEDESLVVPNSNVAVKSSDSHSIQRYDALIYYICMIYWNRSFQHSFGLKILIHFLFCLLCRKIPRDLTEASLSGAGLSILAAFAMIFLFGMVGNYSSLASDWWTHA